MNSHRRLAALSIVVLAAVLAGCGAGHCGPENCAGCCDATDICQNVDAQNCGAAGSACVSCTGEQACVAGACEAVSNPTGGGGSTATVKPNDSSSSSSSSSGSTGGSGSSGSLGHGPQPICGGCLVNTDCLSGFCDMLDSNHGIGFCDSAQPCATTSDCADVVSCEPTGAGYCLCPQTTGGGTTS